MQQGQVARGDVVVVDLDVDPAGLAGSLLQGQAVTVVVDLVEEKQLVRGGVDAAVELAGKQVYPHDAEYQPEDQTHQQHVEDGRDGPDQGVHHHLSREAQTGGRTDRVTDRQILNNQVDRDPRKQDRKTHRISWIKRKAGYQKD